MRTERRVSAAGVALTLILSMLAASEVGAEVTLTPRQDEIKDSEDSAQDAASPEELAQKEAALNSFLGFDWSAGIAVTGDFTSERRIDDAELVNGVVRVKDESRYLPRIMLEAHYLFRSWGDQKIDRALRADGKTYFVTKGHGPFVAIQSSDKQALDSFAAGYLFGWRPDSTKEWSFVMGAGAVLDPNVQILGDGIQANQALPEGETAIRYKKVDRWGWMLMFSFKL